MSIRKSLGNLVVALGGTPSKKSVRGLIGEISEALGGSSTGKTVAEQLDNIALAKDPLFGLKIDVDVAADEDLLGKVIGDLQSNIVIRDNVISGTLKYIDDYTDFSTTPAQQVGHYLVVHASVPNVDNVTITAKCTEEVTLDSDGILVLLVKDGLKQTLTFKASAKDLATVTKVFKFDLRLEEPPEEE